MRTPVVCATLLAVSVISYALCLTQNGFCLDISCAGWPGYELLLMGWREPLALRSIGPFVAFSWYANPCVAIAWLLVIVRVRRAAVTFASAGVLLGFAFLLGRSVVAAKSGGAEAITGYGPGYWLWLVSLSLALLSALLLPASRMRTRH